MTARLARTGLAALALGLIVAISAPLASTEVAAGERTSGPFTVIDPPAPMPDEPFFLDGEEPRTIADYRGKLLVVNFWAKWCAPCVREMPSLDRLQAKMGEEGLEVLAISLDRAGAKIARSFYEANDLNNLAILADKGRKFTRTLGVTGLPTTLIVDGEGRQILRLEGPAEWDSEGMMALLRRHLPGGHGS